MPGHGEIDRVLGGTMTESGRIVMRLFSGVLFTGLIGASCAEIPPTPAVQHQADMQATRTWIRGPLMRTCLDLPGPESQRACAMRV